MVIDLVGIVGCRGEMLRQHAADMRNGIDKALRRIIPSQPRKQPFRRIAPMLVGHLGENALVGHHFGDMIFR